MIAERLQVKAYEPEFDRRAGLKNTYLSEQIDTSIGERLNVRLSKHKYEIKDGVIYGQDMNEPFLAVMRRGVDYRRRKRGEDRVDKKREEAEVIGFSKIQEMMCNPNTPIGTIMLSISPQGVKESDYQNNFYDIFTLKEVEGEKYVEACRYSSALSIEEYKNKLDPLSFTGNIKTDADFLEHPIKIAPSISFRVIFENAEQIHAYLHKDHEVTEVEEFERIKKRYQHLKQKYYITRDPLILDAMMNIADEEAGLTGRKSGKFYSPAIGPSVPLRMGFQNVDQEIAYYGNSPVREVKTGCGSSSSVSSPFSVLDFGKIDLGVSSGETDDLGDREFPCPACGQTNRRPYNDTIALCQNEGCPDPTKVACN